MEIAAPDNSLCSGVRSAQWKEMNLLQGGHGQTLAWALVAGQPGDLLRAVQPRAEGRKRHWEKTGFLLYFCCTWGKKRICHLAGKAKYDAFCNPYLTLWNSLHRGLSIPHSLLCYLLVKFKAKKLLWVGCIYLPFPSLEANVTGKIPWRISLLPEVSSLVCPPPYNQTPLHTWVNLESHLEWEPREPVQWASGNCALEAFLKVKYFWVIFPATFFVKWKPIKTGSRTRWLCKSLSFTGPVNPPAPYPCMFSFHVLVPRCPSSQGTCLGKICFIRCCPENSWDFQIHSSINSYTSKSLPSFCKTRLTLCLHHDMKI